MSGFLGSREGQHATNFFSDIGFGASGTANIFRRADIQNKKNRLLFFFLEGLNKSAVSFCGYIPVNRPDVVAVLVGADVIKLQPRTFKNRMKITLHLAIDSLADLNFVLS